MKMLVCTDETEHSQKTIERAAIIAEENDPEEVAIIHVYVPIVSEIPFGCSPQKIQEYKELLNQQKKEEEKSLLDAVAFFEERDIKATPIFEEGSPKRSPAETILKVATEEGFDTIVIGSKGWDALGKRIRRLFGGVCSIVVQEANKNSACNVIVVK